MSSRQHFISLKKLKKNHLVCVRALLSICSDCTNEFLYPLYVRPKNGLDQHFGKKVSDTHATTLTDTEHSSKKSSRFLRIFYNFISAKSSCDPSPGKFHSVFDRVSDQFFNFIKLGTIFHLLTRHSISRTKI